MQATLSILQQDLFFCQGILSTYTETPPDEVFFNLKFLMLETYARDLKGVAHAWAGSDIELVIMELLNVHEQLVAHIIRVRAKVNSFRFSKNTQI